MKKILKEKKKIEKKEKGERRIDNCRYKNFRKRRVKERKVTGQAKGKVSKRLANTNDYGEK